MNATIALTALFAFQAPAPPATEPVKQLTAAERAEIKLPRGGGPYHMALSVTGKLLAVAQFDDGPESRGGLRVFIWNTITGKSVTVLKGFRDPDIQVQFSADEKQLFGIYCRRYEAGGPRAHEVAITRWDLSDGSEKETVSPGRGGMIFAFSPSGNYAIAKKTSNTAVLLDLVQGIEPVKLAVESRLMNAAAIDKGDKFIATGEIDGTVVIRDLATARVLSRFIAERVGHKNKKGEFVPHGQPTASVRYLEFSSDSRLLIAWDTNRVLRLYTVPDAKLLGAVESVGEVGVLTFCDQCRFTPDGKHVAIIKKEVMELRSVLDADIVAKVCLAEKKEMTPVQLTFSGDGSTAAMLIREAPGICVWSMPMPKPSKEK